MRKTLFMTSGLAGLAWLALTGAAGAAMGQLTPGPQNPQYFAGQAAHANGFTINGATWTNVGGTAETEKGSLANVYAAPLGMGTSQTTGTTYMAVEGGGSEMVTFATPQTSLAIYWGSIDGTAQNLNSFAITIDSYTLTGADLVSMSERPEPVPRPMRKRTSWLRLPALVLSRLRRSPRPPMRLSSALALGFRRPRLGQ